MQVAIDDFGTGYSSLSYLKHFDIDLPQDRPVLRARHRRPTTATWPSCEAIIAMAHKLGLKVMAEGVETEEQLALLKKALSTTARATCFPPRCRRKTSKSC